MKTKPRFPQSCCLCVCATVFLLAGVFECSHAAFAQAAPEVPRVIRYSGTLTLKNDGGAPRTGTGGMWFAIYSDETSTVPLWQEVQNVVADEEGHYSVLLGSSRAEGLPTELFATNEARWLGIRVENEQELPRVLIAAVPYALKAADAETFGGKPLSAFVLNEAASGTNVSSGATAASGSTQKSATTGPVTNSIAIGGTQNRVAKWIDSTTLGDSTIVEDGAGNVGIGKTPSLATMDVNGGASFGTGSFDHAGGLTTGPTSIDATRGALTPEVNFPTFYAPAGVTWSMRVSDGGMLNDTFQWGYNLSNHLYGPQNLAEPQIYWGFESNYPNVAAGLLHTSEMYLRWVAPGATGGVGFVEPMGAYVDRTTGRIFNLHFDSDHIQFAAGDGNPTTPFVVWTPALLDFKTDALFDSPVEFKANATFRSTVQFDGNITTTGTVVRPDTSGYLSAVTHTGTNYGLFFNADAANPSLQLWTNNSARLTIDSTGRTVLGGPLEVNGNIYEVNGNIYLAGSAKVIKADTSGYFTAVTHSGGNYGLYFDANAGNPSIQLWANNSSGLIVDSGGKIRLTAVRGVTTLDDAVPVVIDSTGQLGTISSSREVKQDIADMGEASARVMDLRPVTFRYKQSLGNGSKLLQYGLIAEEVAEAFPELAATNASGKVETVKYHLLPVLLLNEMQRQEKVIRRLEEEIRELREQVGELRGLVAEMDDVRASFGSAPSAASTPSRP